MPDCGELKPLEDFYRATGMRDGRRNECKPCSKGRARSGTTRTR